MVVRDGDRGEQRAHLPGVDQLLPWLLEVDAEPEVVLDLDEQVGQPDRAAAGVQPAVQLGEAVRLRRIEVLGRVRLQPPPIVVERDLPVVSDTLQGTLAGTTPVQPAPELRRGRSRTTLDETRSQDIPWSLCGVLLYDPRQIAKDGEPATCRKCQRFRSAASYRKRQAATKAAKKKT